MLLLLGNSVEVFDEDSDDDLVVELRKIMCVDDAECLNQFFKYCAERVDTYIQQWHRPA